MILALVVLRFPGHHLASHLEVAAVVVVFPAAPAEALGLVAAKGAQVLTAVTARDSELTGNSKPRNT